MTVIGPLPPTSICMFACTANVPSAVVVQEAAGPTRPAYVVPFQELDLPRAAQSRSSGRPDRLGYFVRDRKGDFARMPAAINEAVEGTAAKIAAPQVPPARKNSRPASAP
jgi:hypothetical protein